MNKNISFTDKIFLFFNDTILFFAMALVLFPIIYVVSSSFSSAEAVSTGKVVLFPVDFSLKGYGAVFSYPSIVSGFSNSFFYTAMGTLVNIAMTIIAAYPLSRANMFARKQIMFLFTFTLIFDGGLIPTYLLNNSLGLINTRWVLLIPGAIGIYNMIIARTFFETNIPNELFESASIDGCGHTRFLIKMVIPLSKPIIAVLILYYAVGHWNEYFNAFIYLSNNKLFPLQIILREILILNTVDSSIIVDPELAAAQQGLSDLLKYSLIVVASIPFMIVYPFVSKHFVKGALTGAIKG